MTEKTIGKFKRNQLEILSKNNSGNRIGNLIQEYLKNKDRVPELEEEGKEKREILMNYVRATKVDKMQRASLQKAAADVSDDIKVLKKKILSQEKELEGMINSFSTVLSEHEQIVKKVSEYYLKYRMKNNSTAFKSIPYCIYIQEKKDRDGFDSIVIYFSLDSLSKIGKVRVELRPDWEEKFFFQGKNLEMVLQTCYKSISDPDYLKRNDKSPSFQDYCQKSFDGKEHILENS